jgi:glycoside/pentoside/hexuronide:cation symporter, GPH family
MSGTAAALAAKPPLSLGTKLFYGVGSIAYGVKDQGFSYLLLLYYNQVLHVPASDVGLALLIVLIVDACYDPIIGHWSDNFHSRWGRRHPFMYATALPVSLCYLLLWQPPAGLGPRALFYYLIAVAIVVRFFITLYEIPSSALAPELTENYHDRTQLLGFRTLFQWIGGLALAFLALGVFLMPDATHPFGQLNPAGYADYGWAAGAAILAAILISATGTHRHIPTLKQPPPKRRFVPAQVARDIAQILSRRALLVLLGAGLFAGTAIGLAAALTNYFFTYFWELSAAQIAILLASNLISALIALPGATILSRRLGKKRAAVLLWSVGIVLAPLLLLLRLVGWFPANGDSALIPILFVHSAIAISLFIANNILVASMIADVVEAGQIETGRRAEGLFFAANSFIQKFTSGIGIYSAGLVLALIGFPEGVEPGDVPPAVLSHLVEVYVPMLTLLFLAAIGFVQAYPIDRATHEANLARLGAARAPTATASVPDTVPAAAVEQAALGL